MKWNFVNACEKKIALVRQFELNCFLGSAIRVDNLNTNMTCGAGYQELFQYLKTHLEASLCAGRAITSGPIWSLYTVVASKRHYIEGGAGVEKCKEILKLWSGCSHTVYTLMGKLSSLDNTEIKFRLSSSKVKFKRVTEGMIDPLARALTESSKSGGYETQGILGQQIRYVAGPVGGCEGIPLFPLINFLN